MFGNLCRRHSASACKACLQRLDERIKFCEFESAVTFRIKICDESVPRLVREQQSIIHRDCGRRAGVPVRWTAIGPTPSSIRAMRPLAAR